MISSHENLPLLRNARHNAMVTPVSLLRTRLIHIITRVAVQFYASFEIILEWELSIGLEFKSHVLCKSIASKIFNLIWIIFLKLLNRGWQLGLQRLSPSKARANEVERTPVTYDSFLFGSPATW